MFAIEIELLTGKFAASRHDDRELPEWPPHPARLLFALVATAGRERTTDEEVALEWLCEQPPPAITFSNARPRSRATVFVPVNDRAAPDRSRAAAGTLPRSRQPRTFPCVIPEQPTIVYTWPESEPEAGIRASLASLVERLVYVGHSSSLVRAALVETVPPPSLVPGRGNKLLRVPGEGLLDALDRALVRYERMGIRGPLPAETVRYGVAFAEESTDTMRSAFGELLVLRRLSGPRLPLAAAEQLALALRAAILDLIPDPVPDGVSGHDSDGHPLRRPHVAFVALPDVDHHHSAGALLGAGAIMPRALDAETRDLVARAFEQIAHLHVSQSAHWRVELARVDSTPPLSRGLTPETWTSPALRYGTVTPIELDRYVDDRLGSEAEAVVSESVRHIGLEPPVRVSLSPVSPFRGGGHFRDIRRVAKRSRRPLVHAILEFERPVEGPIVLGSGRYRGIGLCRPLRKHS